VDEKSENYDCFYAAFSKIPENKGIKMNTSQLRNQLANTIEVNPKIFAMVVKAENWIRTRHPQEANKLLFASGLYIEKNTGVIKVEKGDLPKLNYSVNNEMKVNNERGRGAPHDKKFKVIENLFKHIYRFGFLFNSNLPYLIGKCGSC